MHLGRFGSNILEAIHICATVRYPKREPLIPWKQWKRASSPTSAKRKDGEEASKLNWHGDKKLDCLPVWLYVFPSVIQHDTSRCEGYFIYWAWRVGGPRVILITASRGTLSETWFVNSCRNVPFLYSVSIAHSFTVEQFTISPFLSPALSSCARLVTDDFSSLPSLSPLWTPKFI